MTGSLRARCGRHEKLATACQNKKHGRGSEEQRRERAEKVEGTKTQCSRAHTTNPQPANPWRPNNSYLRQLV